MNKKEIQKTIAKELLMIDAALIKQNFLTESKPFEMTMKHSATMGGFAFYVFSDATNRRIESVEVYALSYCLEFDEYLNECLDKLKKNQESY